MKRYHGAVEREIGGPITDDERYAVACRHFANRTPDEIRAIAATRLLDVMILGRSACLEESDLCDATCS